MCTSQNQQLNGITQISWILVATLRMQITTIKQRSYYESFKVRNVQTRTIVFEHDFINIGALTILGQDSAKITKNISTL